MCHKVRSSFEESRSLLSPLVSGMLSGTHSVLTKVPEDVGKLRMALAVEF